MRFTIRQPQRNRLRESVFQFAALAALALFGFAGQAAAQTAPLDTIVDERVWSTLIIQRRADAPGPWRWGVESFLRTRDGVSAIDSAAVRPVVNYNLDKHSSIGGGYGYVVNSPATLDLREHRLFQQYIFTTPSNGGTILVRERLEERIIERNTGTAVRLRSQFRYSHPIKPGSHFSLVGYDELFVYLNSTTVTRQGVDHNRLFGGIGQTLNHTYRYEVGYLNQYIPGHNIIPNRVNHVLSGLFVISF